MTYEEKIEALEKEAKDAAFPFPINHSDICVIKGLSKREYFAAMAMQGYLVNNAKTGIKDDEISRWSVEAADSLMQALNK